MNVVCVSLKIYSKQIRLSRLFFSLRTAKKNLLSLSIQRKISVIPLPTFSLSSVINSIISHLLFIIQILHRICCSLPRPFHLLPSLQSNSLFTLLCLCNFVASALFSKLMRLIVFKSVFFFLFNHGFWSVYLVIFDPSGVNHLQRISYLPKKKNSSKQPINFDSLVFVTRSSKRKFCSGKQN